MMLKGPLTGRRVLLITTAFFGVIVAVNVTMAMFATGSFPGLVVQNSYVASQGFDQARAAQEALGWSVEVTQDAEGVLATVTDEEGSGVYGLTVTGEAARPSTQIGAEPLVFTATPEGFRADQPLAPGRWEIALQIEGPGGETWIGSARLFVPRDDG